VLADRARVVGLSSAAAEAAEAAEADIPPTQEREMEERKGNDRTIERSSTVATNAVVCDLLSLSCSPCVCVGFVLFFSFVLLILF
jgi:hypothetical protein